VKETGGQGNTYLSVQLAMHEEHTESDAYGMSPGAVRWQKRAG
jgi:hypothetical protein